MSPDGEGLFFLCAALDDGAPKLHLRVQGMFRGDP